MMDQIMMEKVYDDIENEKGPIENRNTNHFHTFMYNYCLMHYGLPKISIKILM
jgi:hypothetical protein